MLRATSDTPDTAPTPRDHDLLQKLSPREVEVVTAIGKGRTNREIATDAGISVKTVDTHRMNAISKLAGLGVRNNADLTRFTIRCGLVTP